MKKILDRMFKSTKLSFVIPLSLALLMYLLFIIFSPSPNKAELIIMTPILSIVWLFGVYFIFLLQIKNPSCPEWFLNSFELLATIIFTFLFIMGTVSFFTTGFQNFNLQICFGCVTYSAIALAHSKRTK